MLSYKSMRKLVMSGKGIRRNGEPWRWAGWRLKANLPSEENALFSEVFLVVFGFWWGPAGSRVGNPPPGDEDGVG